MAFWKIVVNITVFLKECGLHNPEAMSCFQTAHLPEALASENGGFVTDLAGISVLSPNEHTSISRNVSCMFKETTVFKELFFCLGAMYSLYLATESVTGRECCGCWVYGSAGSRRRS